MAGVVFAPCHPAGQLCKGPQCATLSRTRWIRGGWAYPVLRYQEGPMEVWGDASSRLWRSSRAPLLLIKWARSAVATLDQQRQIDQGTAEASLYVCYSPSGAEIYTLCEDGQLDRALNLLLIMEQQGGVPSVHVYKSLLMACTIKKALGQAKRLHSHLARCGLESSGLLGDHLVSMLVKCGGLEDSLQVLRKLPYRSAFSWTAVISGCIIAGQGQEALRMYQWMQRDGVDPNAHTFVSLLKACASISDLDEGKNIHADILKYGYGSDIVLCTCLVDMYGKCGSIVDAENAFNSMSKRDMVSWNAMLSAYAQQEQADKVFQLYEQMREEGWSPNDRTFVSLVQACCMLADTEEDVIVDGGVKKAISLQTGKALHAYARTKGYDVDVFVCSTLVTMYGKCGSTVDALNVFRWMSQTDTVIWNAMLAAYIQGGQAEDALKLYEQMLKEGGRPNDRTLLSALRACGMLAEKEEDCVLDRQSGKVNSLIIGKVIHADARRKGCDIDVFVGSTLVSVYGKCGSIEDAQNVFDSLSVQNVVSWTAMLAAYVEQGQAEDALQVYEQMQEEGISPDLWTYVSAIQACGILAAMTLTHIVDRQATILKPLEMGKAIHSESRKRGCHSDVFVVTSLISMYGKCGSIVDARNVFDGSSKSTVVVWTAMMAAYAQQSLAEHSLQLYEQMQDGGVSPNYKTFATAFHACSILASKDEDVGMVEQSIKVKYLGQGKALHAHAQMKGCDSNVFAGNTLISMYGKCRSSLDAQNVFDGLSDRNVVSWTSLLGAYIEQGQAEKALHMYEQMLEEGVSPDDQTFVVVAQACGIVADKEVEVMVDGQWTKMRSLEKGNAIHAHARRKGYGTDVFVGSTLVTMYGKCGSTASAQYVFDLLSKANVVSWTAILGAYVQQGQEEKALQLYKKMENEGTSPDETSLVCILQACSHTGSIAIVRQIHHSLLSGGDHLSLNLANALIHSYGRCASMVDAQTVFNALPWPDVVSWTTLIAGYAREGNFEASLHWYQEMLQTGMKPNGITFLSALSACSHAGLVDTGISYFESMTKEHGITPEIEHYVSMVDILARAGYFSMVKLLLSTMPMQPDLALWLCLLGACRKYGHVELGEQAFQCAVHLKPNHVAAYILMSNIYSDAGLWESAKMLSAQVNALRKQGGAWKKVGQSWIEHEKEVHTFSVGECRHMQQELLRLSDTFVYNNGKLVAF